MDDESDDTGFDDTDIDADIDADTDPAADAAHDRDALADPPFPGVNEPTSPAAPVVGRRGLMTGLALGGVAVVAGAGGAATTSTVFGTGGVRRERVVFDVACLGSSGRAAVREWFGATPDTAFPEGPFVVEGWIYPDGTIPGPGFVPLEEGSLGRWFCRGWFVNSKARGEPHVVTTVDMVFGTITPDRVFPPDVLAIQGIEGTTDKAQPAFRPVVGGTGKYFGAIGQLTQWYLGDNTTDAPSWRYELDLRMLD